MNAIPYGKQYISDDDIVAVNDALKSEFLTQGPLIGAFESAFAKYVNAKYAVALSNGTAALHLCAMALNVGEGTNVITVPITFAATANCIRYCNGKVWFADIDPDTYTLDINSVERLIESKPKGFFSGIIPVDLAGYPVNLEVFKELAKKYDLWIIEDACHAPGGYFIDSNGMKQFCGNSNFANMSIFSFHPVKHIACGEGGMITTNDEELYNKLLLLRTHGITKNPFQLNKNDGAWYYEMQELGYNYRLTDFQAALGISQLKRADAGLQRRREIAEIYFNAFKGKSYIKSQSGVVSGHAYHLYIIQTERRQELYNYLRINNVFCQVHYIPIHTMPYYKQLSSKELHFPFSEAYYKHCLSLPMFPTLTNEEISFVIKVINDFFES
jgi:UDP-4-amino-4,6-dideoxy-N-acetyl-beta-L-altrosamine transaminase